MNEPMKRPCIHGRYDYHVTYYNTMRQVMEDCPGGREVTIDYKAAEAMFKKFWDRPFGSVHSDLKMATAAVDAALGGSDE